MASCVAKWLLLLGLIAACETEPIRYTVRRTYELGQDLYHEAYIFGSLKAFENSLRNHLYREDVEVKCQNQCRFDAKVVEDDIELSMFEHLFEKTSCLEKCFLEYNSTFLLRATGESKFELDTRYVYHYLQFLYQAVGDGLEAIDLVWTYLQKYPENEDMLSNYHAYSIMYPEIARVRRDGFINYDETLLDKIVQNGIKSYAENNMTACAFHMELALEELLNQMDECQKRCYFHPGEVFHYYLSDYISLAEMSVVDCQLDCLTHPSPYGKYGIPLTQFFTQYNKVTYDPNTPVKTLLHYLHFTYFHLGSYRKAGEAAAARLLLIHSESLENELNDLQQLTNLPIHPRSDISSHLDQIRNLESLQLLFTTPV